MKNNKKRSPMMKIVSAAAMLAVSASMLGTSTYAWFSMNKDVTVSGLQMQAKSEDGILIAAYTVGEGGALTAPVANAFTDNANAYNVPTTGAELLPTFTNNGTNWYHNWSKEYNDGQVYGDDGYTSVSNSGSTVYYLMNKFQLKSVTASKAVYVKKVEVTNPASPSAYDASIRVLIKMGDTVQIFNNNGTSWATETAAASLNANDDVTSDVAASATVISSSIATIGTAATGGTDVEIYVYYDGEDPACKSANIASFDTATIKVTFTSDASTIT